MNENILIVVRDINGKRENLQFESRHAVLRWAKEVMTEEDEILIVAQDGLCLYSGLQDSAGPMLTCDDITGFFA